MISRRFNTKMILPLIVVVILGWAVISSSIEEAQRDKAREEASVIRALTATSEFATLNAPPTPTSTPVAVTFDNICDHPDADTNRRYVTIRGRFHIPGIYECRGEFCRIWLLPEEGSSTWWVNAIVRIGSDPNQFEHPLENLRIYMENGMVAQSSVLLVSGTATTGAIGGFAEADEGGCNLWVKSIVEP